MKKTQLTKMTLAALALAFSGTMAMASITANDVADAYKAKGYTVVSITTVASKISIHAVKGDTALDVVYDAKSGAILKQSRGKATAHDVSGDDSVVGGDDSVVGGDDSVDGGDDSVDGGDDSVDGGDDSVDGGDDSVDGGDDGQSGSDDGGDDDNSDSNSGGRHGRDAGHGGDGGTSGNDD